VSPAHPSTRPSTCVVCRPSGPALEFNVRLAPAVASYRLILSPGLRLASPAGLPVLPLELNLRLSSAVVLLRFNLPIRLRLAPPPDCPAFPLNSTSGLHRLSHRPAHPFTRPSTCVACRPSGPAFRTQPPTSHRSSHLRLILPVDLWLAPPIDPPAPPSN